MLNYIRKENIVVVVPELDRLGRSSKELAELMINFKLRGMTFSHPNSYKKS